MTSTDQDDFSLPLAVLVSLLVHVCLFFLLHQTITNPHTTDTQQELQNQAIDVTVLSELPKQIVSKTISQPDAKPVQTNHESDSDTQVVKEQIKRGMEPMLTTPGEKNPIKARVAKPSPNKETAKEKTEPAKPSPQKSDSNSESQAKPAPQKLSLSDLTLDSKELISNFSVNSAQPQNSKNQTPRSPSYRGAFSRPAGSGARFMTNAGSPDSIPNLPDGDLTLLNAKANQFAVFVRRVAIQVFTQIRALGWDNLDRADIERIKDYSTVIATMSPSGALLKVTLDGQSASSTFDGIIMQAAKAGTKDPNPPAAAKAADGNIKFIFKAKSWVETDRGRSGIPVERRWILLETGLE